MKLVLRAAMISLVALVGLLATLQILFSEAQLPLGTNATMSVNLDATTVDKKQLIADFAALGEQTGATIYKIVPDINDSTYGTNLYVLGGEQPRAAYPITYLDPSRHGNVYPSADLRDASLQGQYALRIDDAGVSALKSWASARGVRVFITQVTPELMASGTLTATGSWIAVLAGGVLIATSILAWFASRSTSRAYRLLSGHSKWRIHVEDTVGLLLACLVPLLVGAAILLGVAAATRGLDNAIALARVVALGLGLVLTLLTLLGILVSALTRPTISLLAHRTPTLTRFQLTSALLKFVAVAVAAGSIPLLAGSVADSYAASQSMTRWAPLTTFVGVRIRSAQDGSTPQMAELGRLAIRSETAQETVLSLGETRADLDVDALGNFDGVVIVNDGFLHAMAHDPAVERAVPISFTDIPAGTRSYLADQLPVWLRTPTAMPGPFRFLTLTDTQGWPALGVGSTRFTAPHKALVVVVSTLAVLSDDFLSSTMSTQNLVFQNPDTLRAGIAATKTGGTIISVDRIADTDLVTTQFAFQVMVLRIMSLALILLALTLSGAIAAQVYAVQNIRRVFPQRTAGWSWGQILSGRLLAETALACSVSALAAVVMIATGQTGAAWAAVAPLIYVALSYALHRHYVAKIFGLSVQRQVA